MQKQTEAVLTLGIVACLCSQGIAGLPRDYSQGVLDRERVCDSARQITRTTYPNANRVYVDDLTLCFYQPDGTGVTWSENYTKILTEKGRSERQYLAFEFVLPYTQVSVTLLELIKPDGSVVPIDIDKQSQIVINHYQMSSNIYNSRSKVLRVGVPGLQVNDVIHLVTCHETHRRIMPNSWDDFQVFEAIAPIRHAVYEVHAPKAAPLESIALRDPFKDTVTYSTQERDREIVYRWEVTDVPRFYVEPDMPPSYTVIQRLLVSTISDWSAISRWYWRLCQPHIEATRPAIQDMVNRLTEGAVGRQNKIEAIFFWVSQQVRYMGIIAEDESPGWEPHDAWQTFENRHGICRDKAALLVTMLRLAGFEAYPVLVDTTGKTDLEVPAILFDHAIVAVKNPDGSYQFMDCTDESSRDLFPRYLCNCRHLIANPEGETLQTFPVVLAQDNMMRVKTFGKVDAQGNLTGKTELAFEGINDTVFRNYFARIKPEERRRYFEGIIQASIPVARLTAFDFRPVEIQDMSTELSIRMEYAADDILIRGGDTAMIPVPQVGTKVGLLNSVIGRAALPQRRFPLRLRSTCGVQEEISLQIDPANGSIASLPSFMPIENPVISWKYALRRETDRLWGQSEFRIEMMELDPQHYLRLKDGIMQIEYNERKMPILDCAADNDSLETDVVVLDFQVEYNLTDAHNWTESHHVCKKITSYRGVKNNAELKLHYNPAWEDIRLIRATVTNEGQTKEVSKGEVNLMDAAWVGAAPRYPPGKTLVVSLPAVQIGSVIEYEYERKRRDRPFFSVTHVFRSFDLNNHQRIVLTAPSSLALQTITDDNGIAISDEGQDAAEEPIIVERIEHQAGRTCWQWTSQHQSPIKKEDFLPPLACFNPVLRITSGNWQAYAEDVLCMLRRGTQGQTATERAALEITRDQNRPEDKIIAIRDFVAKNIRSAGPGRDELPMHVVTSADQTLRDGYGNMTDRAVLLYSMLKAVHLSPEFVLASSSPPIEELRQFAVQYSSTEVFDKLLVRLRLDQMDVYLNDTGQYAILGATPSDGHLALSLAQGKAETISIEQDKRDLIQYEHRLTLTDQGKVDLAVLEKTYGDSFAHRHRVFAEMPPEERNRYYQELTLAVSKMAIASDDLVTDFEVYPGVNSFLLEVEKYAVRDHGFLYFELPVALKNLFSLQSFRRENPFYSSRRTDYLCHTIIELPSEFSNIVLMPGQEEWTLPAQGGIVRIRSDVKQGQGDGKPTSLAFTHELRLSPFFLEARRYADLLKIERQLAHVRSRMVLLSVEE